MFSVLSVVKNQRATRSASANQLRESVQIWSISNPLSRASICRSDSLYLYEFSVWIVSPSSNSTFICSPSIATDCFRRLTRCISILLSRSLKKARCSKLARSKRPPSSRLIRARRFKLNDAVTPSESLYAGSMISFDF